MFSRLLKPLSRADAPIAPHPSGLISARATTPVAPRSADGGLLAIIAGRDCLAYQGTFCTACHERCPVAGAIAVERGLPRVVPETCTGCGVCHEACPAPENAIRVVPRPPGLRRPARPPASGAASPFPQFAPTDAPRG